MNKCKYVAHLDSLKKKTRNSSLGPISGPIGQYELRHPPADTSDSKPQIGLTRPTPRGTLLDPEKQQSSDIDGTPRATLINTGTTTQAPTHDLSPDDTEGRFFSDVQTFSSSPHQASRALPSLSPVGPVTSPMSPMSVRWRHQSFPGMYLSFLSCLRRSNPRGMTDGRPVPRRRTTILTNPQSFAPSAGTHASRKYEGNGGFPGPIWLANLIFQRVAPSLYVKFGRKLTVTRTKTLEEKSVKWLKFDGLVIGRNSDFRTETLSDEKLEQLGGTEYRAIRLLSYLVPAVSLQRRAPSMSDVDQVLYSISLVYNYSPLFYTGHGCLVPRGMMTFS